MVDAFILEQSPKGLHIINLPHSDLVFQPYTMIHVKNNIYTFNECYTNIQNLHIRTSSLQKNMNIAALSVIGKAAKILR